MIKLNFTYTGIEIQVYKNGLTAWADSTPTATLFRNGTTTSETVTVTATAQTGRYLASFTTLGVDDGWSVNDHLTVRTVAIISGVSYPTISFDSFAHPPLVADSNVVTMEENTLTASSLATDAINEIQSGLSTFDGDLSSITSAISAIPTNPLLATNYVAPDNAGIANIPNLLSNLATQLEDYGDANWVSDLSTVESNIGLLLNKNMLTLGKAVTHSPTQIVIGSNEVVIDLVVDEDNDTVTGIRTT